MTSITGTRAAKPQCIGGLYISESSQPLIDKDKNQEPQHRFEITIAKKQWKIEKTSLCVMNEHAKGRA